MPPSEALVGLKSLRLRHGMSTRRLGNMKDPQKRKAAASLAGLPEPLFLKQMHGTVIHRASHSAQGLEGDGWVLGPGDEGMSVGVFAADCVPLYLWSDDGRFAGIFHAGWRGMAEGMPRRAVEALRGLGADVGALSAAAGPHIGVCCYKVGPELEERFPASSFVRRDGALYLDLAAETRRQLLEAGLRPGSIGAPPPCTASHPEDYFSYRRDKVDARMFAFISLERGTA